MKTTLTFISLAAALTAAALFAQETNPAAGPDTPGKTYDPLRLPSVKPAVPVDLTVKDANRSREIPVRVYLPTDLTSNASA